MQPTDDRALLRQYAEAHSDEAFAALVAQHINLVYSVAVRHLGDPHQAEEVTQAVFILLARKAGQLRNDKALSSWLFQTTRLTARNLVRAETRRHRREQEAHVLSLLSESGSEVWSRIAPLLDDAVAGLSEIDRHAVVLRFYEGRSMREVGAALDASEDAAEKRVSRALDKLRTFFRRRGIPVGASGLALLISANAVEPAPAALAATISTVAAAAGAPLAATAKVAALVKSSGSAGLGATVVGPLIGLLGGVFGAYMSIEHTKSLRERQFMIRAAWLCAALVALFGLLVLGMSYFGRALIAHEPGLVVGLIVLLALLYSGVLLGLVLWTNRRQRQIQVEDGTYVEPSMRRALANRCPARAAIYSGLGGGIVGATAWLVLAALRAQDWWGAGMVVLVAAGTFVLSAGACLRKPQHYWLVLAVVCFALGVGTVVLVNLRWSDWFANNPDLKGWSALGLSGFVVLLYTVLTAVFLSRQRRAREG